MIDDIVKSHGQATITIRRVVDPVFDANDVLDEDASTIETEDVSAIVSNPSDEAGRRQEGRASTASITVTVPSDTDVKTNRGGLKDEVVVPGYSESYGESYGSDVFNVDDVQDVEHPFVDVAKKTLVLSEKGGR